jgi:hypothetical protein
MECGTHHTLPVQRYFHPESMFITSWLNISH